MLLSSLLTEKIQRLQGELTTLRTDVVTRQQREKELYGQLQHQAAEIKRLEMVSGENCSVISNSLVTACLPLSKMSKNVNLRESKFGSKEIKLCPLGLDSSMCVSQHVHFLEMFFFIFHDV